MQLAISGTELGPMESVTDLVDCALEVGVSFVELWYPRNTNNAGLERTIDILQQAKLRIACVSTGSELYRQGGSLEDQALLIEAIELAGSIGARFANTYFGYHSVQDDDAAIEMYLQFLHPCLQHAEKHGVTIVLENEFNAFGLDHVASDITRRPTSLRRLFKAAQSPFFLLNFDPCNFYCAGVEPYPYAYELLRPFIAYSHVKDGCRYDSDLMSVMSTEGWRRFTDYESEYVMRPLGEGALPWANLLRRMRADGYNGFLTLEPHAETELRRQAWKQAADFVRSQW